MPTAFELEREANIKRNTALLETLGLATAKETIRIPTKPVKPKAAPKKRKVAPTENELERPSKASRRSDATETQPLAEGLRRSSRNAGKTVDYHAEQDRGVPEPVAIAARRKNDPTLGKAGREDGKRIHDPKTFGSIPGIEVGTWWDGRKGCSVDAVHAPLVAGISGGSHGAYSIALSGGYEDDVDLGYAFTYTGSGGRELKGTKAKPKNLRTAPQTLNQTFDNHFNQALKVSSENKKPVRVIRGFKLRSKFAPASGYRYDGLYKVEKAWIESGLNAKGLLVCKFAFTRLPGQPPLPERGEGEEDEAASASDENDEQDNDASTPEEHAVDKQDNDAAPEDDTAGNAE